MIAVVIRNLFDQAKDVDFGATKLNTNARNGRFFELAQVGDQFVTQGRKLSYGDVAVTLQIAPLSGPIADVDRIQVWPRLAEYPMNAQTIKVGLAITNVPEVLQQRRLVIRGQTLK